MLLTKIFKFYLARLWHYSVISDLFGFEMALIGLTKLFYDYYTRH